MSEPCQPSEATPASSSHPAETLPTPGISRVQIILTPPTPVVGDGGFIRREEDTYKEVTQLDKITEEKEVHVRQEVPDEKQVYTEDEKEVYSPVQAQRIDASEKEVYRPTPSGDGVEKEVYIPTASPDQVGNQFDTGNLFHAEKKVHNAQAPVAGSEQFLETQDDEHTARPSIVQRQLSNVSMAVEKRKKALTTFTTQSNNRMREGYARMEQSVTERGVAIERGANNRFTRLEKGLNDQINRAGKNVNSRVTSLKQSVSSIKKMGSRGQASENENENQRRRSE
ncbi:hypothetical protein QQZ08_003697 [Neonectria magnoliae]|uniref:Uncharacterized protein n=1 Tax=Neonectria magnoliae TaxID=2732573 RepID=A0ABR1I8E9_9HYPO